MSHLSYEHAAVWSLVADLLPPHAATRALLAVIPGREKECIIACAHSDGCWKGVLVRPKRRLLSALRSDWLRAVQGELVSPPATADLVRLVGRDEKPYGEAEAFVGELKRVSFSVFPGEEGVRKTRDGRRFLVSVFTREQSVILSCAGTSGIAPELERLLAKLTGV